MWASTREDGALVYSKRVLQQLQQHGDFVFDFQSVFSFRLDEFVVGVDLVVQELEDASEVLVGGGGQQFGGDRVVVPILSQKLDQINDGIVPVVWRISVCWKEQADRLFETDRQAKQTISHRGGCKQRGQYKQKRQRQKEEGLTFVSDGSGISESCCRAMDA